MGIFQSRHRLNDDEYFSAISGSTNADGEEEEEEELVAITYEGDELLAEELQLQEILAICVKESCSMRPTTSPPLVVEAFCNICMESKPLSQFLQIKLCSHKFCLSCVDQLALPRGTFERWCNVLCQSMVEAKFYCPFSECSALLEAADGEEEEVVTASECPHCNRLFCAQCKVPWHQGIDCREFQKLGLDERGAEDLLLREMATKLRWQRCPQCKITVERIDGCRFMRCR